MSPKAAPAQSPSGPASPTPLHYHAHAGRTAGFFSPSWRCSIQKFLEEISSFLFKHSQCPY